MSILIKGMEMPKSCWDCFACHDGWCIINQKIEGHRTVTHSCPLIEVPKWIPVTERLPEDGAEVLAFNKTGFAYVDCWTDGKWKINSMVDEEHESVTHWMPLPQPPESVEE